MRWVLLIALFLGVFSAAEAQDGTRDFYLRAAGDNAEAGTSYAAAWKTFKYAFTNATTANDTIFVYDDDGDFTRTAQEAHQAGASTLWVPRNGITLYAPDGEAPVYDGEGAVHTNVLIRNTITGDYTIDGLTIKDWAGNTYMVYASVDATSLRFKNCTFDNPDWYSHSTSFFSAFRMQGNGATSTDYFELTNCKWINVAKPGYGEGDDKPLISAVDLDLGLIQNCQFGDMAAATDTSYTWGQGMTFDRVDSLTIRDNVFYGAGGADFDDADCAASPFTNCDGSRGIQVGGSAPSTNIGIHNNRFIRKKSTVVPFDSQNHRFHNGDAIVVLSNADGVYITGNLIDGTGHGIQSNGENVFIQSNVVMRCLDDGVFVDDLSASSTVKYNLIWDVNNNGLDTQGDNTVMSYNTVMWSSNTPLNIASTCASVTMSHNVVYGVKLSGQDTFVDKANGSTVTSLDYNIYWDPNGYATKFTNGLAGAVSFGSWQGLYDILGMFSDYRISRPLYTPNEGNLLYLTGNQYAGRANNYSPSSYALKALTWTNRSTFPGALAPWR